MAHKYLVQLKAAEPFHIDADSIAIQNPHFLFVIKGGTVIAAFPRETVDYVVDASLANVVASAHAGWREATSKKER